MANFLNFIDDDIKAKKTLISAMPTRTKTNVKKFNEKIDSILENYNNYQASTKKYIVTKSKSFNMKKDVGEIDNLTKNVNDLDQLRLLLNPTNTFFEKMGFDTLLFEIRNYSDFNFNSMNEIISKFINKFEKAGIMLLSTDFDYTCYVKEYMSSFLEVRNMNAENYEALSKIFEKVYWENPEIIHHIELNFRKLVKKHRKKFISYIETIQKEVMWKTNINNYKECLERLKSAYNDLEVTNKESISDIINLSKNGDIEITNYYKESKSRISGYNAMMIDAVDLNDNDAMDKFHSGLEKLQTNIEEYSNFIKFLPLFKDFKNEYEKQISNLDDKQRKGGKSKSKLIESQISDKEAKLSKLNKQIFTGDLSFFDFKSKVPVKKLKVDSVIYAKELYSLYQEYDREVFNEKILAVLNNFFTIPQLLHLYYSYDFFKKEAIKRVFNLNTYDEVISYSDEFTFFAKNPNNIIINGIPVFKDNDVAKIIVNKYRLDNINITEENLEPETLEELLNKIQFLLRSNEIEKGNTTPQKIWFMTKVEKIIEAENKKNKTS